MRFLRKICRQALVTQEITCDACLHLVVTELCRACNKMEDMQQDGGHDCLVLRTSQIHFWGASVQQ